jgi:hypothetical protein
LKVRAGERRYPIRPAATGERAGANLLEPRPAARHRVRGPAAETRMTYPVRCECGKVYRLSAALAGSHYACACGRELIVPSLSELKMAAGEEVLSPAVRLEQMLQLGMLPQETKCLVCGRTTAGVTHFWAICERAFVKEDPSRVWWAVALGWLFLGWLGVLLLAVRARDDRIHGSDVRLRLPLRVCPECAPDLAGPGRFREAVLAAPLYADLLRQYPAAEIALDAERKGVDLSAPGPR